VLCGAIEDEVLLSTYVCHPSLANDNLSGVLETDERYVSQNPKGEPQLGIYRGMGGGSSRDLELLWELDLADGHNGLIDMAEWSRLPFVGLREAAGLFREHGLLETAE
jgi:aminopeptidase-like protein